METLHKNGQADKEAVDDAKTNLAIAYLNFVFAEVKLAAAATKSAASAESLYTGFYADLQLSIKGTKTNSNTNSSTAVASNILSNGNLTISSGMSGPGLDVSGDTTVTGSSLISATGDINIASKGNTVINASKDTYNSSTSSKSWAENLTLATTNAAGAGALIDNAVNALQISLGLSMSKSKGDTNSTTYNNSQLTANSGSIKINSLNNATFSGADLLAKNIELNTAGDLTIESLQNSYKAKGSSFGMNLGGGGGSSKGSGNISLGINYSSNKTDRLWTDNQTSILGTNSVTINTGDATNLKGAVIANITNIPNSVILAQAGIQEFLNSGSAIDGNNLTLNSNSLTFSNLYDHEYSQSSGFGISTNIGRGSNNTNGQGSAPATNPNQQTNYYPNGSTTISAQNSGYKKEQTTFATLGNGDITTNTNITFDTNGNLLTNSGGALLTNADTLLTGLNRDINNSQVMTKDTITNALNVTTTIDNRIIAAVAGNKDAQNSLSSEQKNLGKNLVITTDKQIDMAGKVWASPNTVIGLTYGAAGYLYGAAIGKDVKVSIGNNAVQFEGNPLNPFETNGAITLGNSINYLGKSMPDSGATNYWGEYYTYEAKQKYMNSGGEYQFSSADKIILGDHERAHTYQYQVLGSAFLPVYLLSGAISSKNWLENSADKVGNEAYLKWKENNKW